MTDKVLIAGCGDIGRRVGSKWVKRSAAVTGVVRSEASVERLRGTGIFALRTDLDTTSKYLPVEDSLVYYFVPPSVDSNTDTRMRKFVSLLSRADRPPTRIIMISTTGVYGDAGGQWITETSAVNASTDRAKRRLDAESALEEWSSKSKVPIVILRVGGIYGPGRLPIRFIKSGQALPPVHNSSYTNHIHANDLANVCLAASRANFSAGIYNATDGKPMRMVNYFNKVAEFLGLDEPPSLDFGAAMDKLSPAMQSYLKESRRISNRKLLLEMGSGLKYPTLEDGLPSCVTPDMRPKAVNDPDKPTRETT